jgi:hypothetical protein
MRADPNGSTIINKLVGAPRTKILPGKPPDMNPIDGFRQAQTVLRQAPQRIRDGRGRRIGALLDRFASDECADCLRVAGYGDSF